MRYAMAADNIGVYGISNPFRSLSFQRCGLWVGGKHIRHDTDNIVATRSFGEADDQIDAAITEVDGQGKPGRKFFEAYLK